MMERKNINKKVIFLFITLFIFFHSSALFSEDVWLKSGKGMEDTENIKAKDGFGAQLWLISNPDLFEKWDTPELPKLNPVRRVKRNNLFYAVIIFAGPGINKEDKCDVVWDIKITKPDGSIYADIKDLEAWRNGPSFPENEVQLATQHIGIVIEEKDPLGEYTVDTIVRDNIKKVSLFLRQKFLAEEE